VVSSVFSPDALFDQFGGAPTGLDEISENPLDCGFLPEERIAVPFSPQNLGQAYSLCQRQGFLVWYFMFWGRVTLEEDPLPVPVRHNDV